VVADHVNVIKGNAQKIMETKDNSLRSQLLGEAFISAADALKIIQENKIPNASKDVLQVMDIAKSYDTDMIILDQKIKIKRFFDQTAKVVKEANVNVERPS
jgi:hypothetical protein